jgi:hypothetical protein
MVDQKFAGHFQIGFIFDCEPELPNVLRQRRACEEAQPDPVAVLFQIMSNARGVDLSSSRVSTNLEQYLRHHRGLQYSNLRSLVFRPNDRYDPGAIPTLPSLRRLICHAHSSLSTWQPPIINGSIPWASLTHISIHTMSISGSDWCTLTRCLDATPSRRIYNHARSY